MSLSDLSSDLKGMLGSSADKFNQEGRGDLDRLLNTAAAALSRDKPQNMSASLLLVADQADYDVPALLIKAIYSDWGKKQQRERQPWQRGFPDRLPSLNIVKVEAGKRLRLTPPPTALQIADLGADFVYYYTGRYKIGAKPIDTTVDECDRDLLLLRATIAAMQDLALSHASTPVSLGPGKFATKTGTPSAVAVTLMTQYEGMLI